MNLAQNIIQGLVSKKYKYFWAQKIFLDFLCDETFLTISFAERFSKSSQTRGFASQLLKSYLKAFSTLLPSKAS